MADIILDNIYLILLLPLWIFLIIMSARFFAVYVNNKIIYTLTLLSSFFGILLCSVSLLKLTAAIEQSFPFIKIGNFVLDFGLHVDKLSLIIALVLFLVSFLVQMFSIPYMKDEPKQYRFYAYLNMFNFSMAGLLFSPNLFQMYFFWELVGVMSYLLIGFDYKNIVKSEASRRVFLMNRVGDTALLGGIIFASYLMYNYAGNRSFTTLSFEDMNAVTTLISAYTETPVFYLLCILFIICTIPFLYVASGCYGSKTSGQCAFTFCNYGCCRCLSFNQDASAIYAGRPCFADYCVARNFNSSYLFSAGIT